AAHRTRRAGRVQVEHDAGVVPEPADLSEVDLQLRPEAAGGGERPGNPLERLQRLLGGRERLGPREQLARFRLRARRLRQQQERVARFSRSHLALAQAPQRRAILATWAVKSARSAISRPLRSSARNASGPNTSAASIAGGMTSA